ncbi:hypothetical protein KIL84_011511 [Mauremys mutica]|uniref:Uncharacterized protein n=1 Tax=Mauremys mutica TaxID=74926 RepID=A0A9D4B218_9SAUR|nr:hypothetical protein KIL84_011511 [Mauremys mutica]
MEQPPQQRPGAHTVTTTSSSFTASFSPAGASTSTLAYDREFLRTAPGVLMLAEIVSNPSPLGLWGGGAAGADCCCCSRAGFLGTFGLSLPRFVASLQQPGDGGFAQGLAFAVTLLLTLKPLASTLLLGRNPAARVAGYRC